MKKIWSRSVIYNQARIVRFTVKERKKKNDCPVVASANRTNRENSTDALTVFCVKTQVLSVKRARTHTQPLNNVFLFIIFRILNACGCIIYPSLSAKPPSKPPLPSVRMRGNAASQPEGLRSRARERPTELRGRPGSGLGKVYYICEY